MRALPHWANFKKTSPAFSLIEVLLVLFILAFVFTFASQKLFRKSQGVKSAFEQIIRLNRRLVNSSQLHNKTYRLVIQWKGEGADQYWVEKQRLKNNSSEEETEDTSRERYEFVIDESFYSQPKALPSLLDIQQVKGSLSEEEDLLYIYYYPKGLAQEITLELVRRDNQGSWSLYLDPVTKDFQVIKNQGEG